MTPQNETDLRKFLTPFADGELDVEQSLRVLEHMAMNPQATKRVMHQQQLRQSIGKYFADHTPPAPPELQTRLEGLFPAEAPIAKNIHAWWIISLAAAALGLVFTGAWLGRATMRAQLQKAAPTTANAAPAAPTTAPVPMNVVGGLLRAHVNCSRLATHTHSKLFPTTLESLTPPIEQYLRITDLAVPDLDEMDFQFAGAEPCQLPGGMTVHLLYRGKGLAQHDAISVFLQRDKKQLNIPDHTSFNASTLHAAHPLFIWCRKGVVYYLVGDSADNVKRAAKLAGAPVMP